MNRFLPLVCVALPLWSAAQEQQGLSGFEAFAQEPAMSSAAVSPDGRHLATLQRFAKDGKQFLLVYELADMAKRPVTLGSDRMDIVSAAWANDERLIVRFRQDVETLQRLGADTRQVSKLATVDRQGRRWLEIPRRRADRRRETARTMQEFAGAAIFDLLPRDDDHILITYDDDQNRVADIFRVNVETGSAQRVGRNSNRISITYMDDDGDPRLANRFDEGEEAIIELARLKGETDWIEIGRTQANVDSVSSIFEAFRLAGPSSSNEFYVRSNHETDTVAIYTFDLKTGEFGEMQFMHPQYDATGVRTRLDEDRNDVIIGFTYTGRAGDVYLVDPDEKALYDALGAILPDTHNRIVSRSHDGKTMVIRAEGPKTPPSWYLLRDGRLDLLGRSMPFLTEDMLAEVEWTRYEARDGLEIPALVTVPRGDGPFPLVVLPHGGPVARDYWGFDVWAQLLAYHGYLVIQPQFRISEGFGRKHMETGYARWGHEMQDDLEDAIDYLADRGLGDADRAAIFGWSYGGYAAFVGSFRDPNPFHCAIAGAGVADLPYFRAWLADSGTLAEKAYRPTVDGLNPLEHVDSVDVPILVIHGDIDERVPVAESRKFVAGLREYGKRHKYIELEGANHFFGTIYYRHYMEMYPAMIDWLDNTCNLKANAAASR